MATSLINEVRRSNLYEILKNRFAGDLARFAEATDLKVRYLKDILIGIKRLSNNEARQVELRLGLAEGALDIVEGKRMPTGSALKCVRAVNILRLLYVKAKGSSMEDVLRKTQTSKVLSQWILFAPEEFWQAILASDAYDVFGNDTNIVDQFQSMKNKFTFNSARRIEQIFGMDNGALDRIDAKTTEIV